MLKTQCCLSQCSHRGGFVFLSSDSKPRTKQQLVISIKWGDELGIMWKPSVTSQLKTRVVCDSHFVPSDFIQEMSYGMYI